MGYNYEDFISDLSSAFMYFLLGFIIEFIIGIDGMSIVALYLYFSESIFFDKGFDWLIHTLKKLFQRMSNEIR